MELYTNVFGGIFGGGLGYIVAAVAGLTVGLFGRSWLDRFSGGSI